MKLKITDKNKISLQIKIRQYLKSRIKIEVFDDII